MKGIMKTFVDNIFNTFMPAMFWKTLCTTGKGTIWWSTRNFQKKLRNLLSVMIASGYKTSEKEEQQSLSKEINRESTE